MSEDTTIKCTPVFGYVGLKGEYREENGRVVYYSWSVRYDINGKEVSRTEPEVMSSIGWDDGSPFTLDDIKLQN